ncbi:hypothetical protein [Ruegeria sp. HKCCA0235A]|uniref:hypothetical protein n=1 Tax=Ruegeria sp. HKCCA0235A TaxID=2682998 RepID=UPI001489C719|nr:hypothetical protein [Ruegeria sp. HKCCA0235A]
MGKSGAARVKSGDLAYATAMQSHEERLDYAGAKRRVRDVPPLIYSPYAALEAPDPDRETRANRSRKDRLLCIDRFIRPRPADTNFTIWDALQSHIAGARKSKAAKKEFLHAFLQYPTDLELDAKWERIMLRQAVEFINLTYGGNAVFHARLDRDEVGRHGVDVFFAPRYEKHTKAGVTQWVSLSKFSKENARRRYQKREKRKRDSKTGDMVTVLDKSGKPVMIWNDSGKFQGRALQDAWHEHLQDSAHIKWAERGKRKRGNDPDCLSPEEYAAQQEAQKLRAEVDRQLDDEKLDQFGDTTLQKTASKLIEKAGERASNEAILASKHIEEVARRDAEAMMDRVFEGAKADADAITHALLSDDARKFVELKKENESLRAEVIRQSQIIQLISRVLRSVLPPKFRNLVKSAYEAGRLEQKRVSSEVPLFSEDGPPI